MNRYRMFVEIVSAACLVLEQGLEEHSWRKAGVHSDAYEIGREVSVLEIDHVSRPIDTGLEVRTVPFDRGRLRVVLRCSVSSGRRTRHVR